MWQKYKHTSTPRTGSQSFKQTKKQNKKTCKQKRYCLIKIIIIKKKRTRRNREKMERPVYKLGEQTVIRVVLRSKYIQSINSVYFSGLLNSVKMKDLLKFHYTLHWLNLGEFCEKSGGHPLAWLCQLPCPFLWKAGPLGLAQVVSWPSKLRPGPRSSSWIYTNPFRRPTGKVNDPEVPGHPCSKGGSRLTSRGQSCPRRLRHLHLPSRPLWLGLIVPPD